MRRIPVLSAFVLLSCMPGACQQKVTEKITQKVAERMVEKTLEGGAEAGEKVKVDVGDIRLPQELKKKLPPGFVPKMYTKEEDGFFLAGVVKNSTRKEIMDHLIKIYGKPMGEVNMGFAVALTWKDGTNAVINGKKGSIEIFIAKGKKARKRLKM